MADFETIVHASEEGLIQLLYRYKDDHPGGCLGRIAADAGLHPEQFLCALGFNPSVGCLSEILPLLGYADFAELYQERNAIFAADIYRQLRLEDVLQIYSAIKDDTNTLDVMQHLLSRRLENIEGKIEATVNTQIIEKYRAEMYAIYHEGIARIAFAEERLNKADCGFRALLNEVAMIIDSRLIPAGNIFFRETILPEEKRKILNTGLIPHDLIQSRLGEEAVSAEEQQVLKDYLQQQRQAR